MSTDPIRAALQRLVNASLIRDQEWHAALTDARAALSAAPPIAYASITYEWSLMVDDEEMAGGSGPTLEDVEREASHYLQCYSNDGRAAVQIRAVQIIMETTP